MARRVLQIVGSLEACDATSATLAVSMASVASGDHVVVLSLGGEGPLAERLRQAGTQVRWISPPIRHVSQLIYWIRVELQRFQPDIIHTWTEQANRVGRLAAMTARVPHFIASYRWIPRRPSLWARTFDRSLARWTDVAVVNSRTSWEAFDRDWSNAGQLRLIVDGIARRSAATLEERDRVRAELGVPANAKLLGTVGPLIPGKRLKDVIWSTDLLRVFYRDIYLLVIGDGPRRWRLERYASQVQDAPRTRFLGSRVDQDVLIGALDCLCQMGQYESAPRAVLEAMAAGIPVVASDVAGHRELIEADQTGLLIPSGQRGALAQQIHRVLEDAALARRLGQAAQSRAREHFPLDKMVRAHLDLYNEVTSNVATTQHNPGRPRQRIR